MLSAKNPKYSIIHAQKILFGQSNKFSSGYLVIRGQTIEKFIPETAGIAELTDEQKNSIVEIPNHQYVLPGIIDTNVSLHNESYDKDWVDNKYLSLLAVKYGITTIINQSFLKPNQSDNNKPNLFNPSGEDINIRVSYKESNFQQEIKQDREEGSIKLIKEIDKQDKIQIITKPQQHSQIFSDENEKICTEDNETIGQCDVKNYLQILNNKNNDKQQGNFVIDFSEDKYRQECEYGIEPSTNSRTHSCELENQNKQKELNEQDSHLDLFCDFQSINIPDQKDIYEVQKNKLSPNRGKSPSLFKNSNQQDQDSNSQPKIIPQANYSLNKYKLYTSPPIDPNVPFFTKPEQIAGFIKIILDKQELYDNKSNNSHKSSHLDEDECNIEQDNYNQSGFQNYNKNKQCSKFDDIENKKEEISEEILNQDRINQSLKQNSIIFQKLQKKVQSNENVQNINSQNLSSSYQEELNIQDRTQNQDQQLDSELTCNQEKDIHELQSDCNQENTNQQKEQILDIQIEFNKQISITQSEKQKNQNEIKQNINSEIFSQKTELSQNSSNDKTDIRANQQNLQKHSRFQQNQSMNVDNLQEGDQNNDQLELIRKDINESQQFTSIKKKNICNIDSESEKRNNFDKKDNCYKGECKTDISSSSQKNIETFQSGIDNKNQEQNKFLEYNKEQDFEQEEKLKQKNQDSQYVNDIEQFRKQDVGKQSDKQSYNYDEYEGEQTNTVGLICDFIIKDDEQEEIDHERNGLKTNTGIKYNGLISKRKQKQSQPKNKKSKKEPIFFIHPSFQQGDNNLALSSPFRQQQFSERIILQKQPPKVGGDALRAPFEKDYEEAMQDLKYIDLNQDDYNEEIKQFLSDIFEASKENSKAYTDHLINHSQLSDYNSDLMDETDRSDNYEFKIDKQSLIWPQPSYQLKFDKERNFFNKECSTYQLEKNIFQQQQEPENHKFSEYSQLFINDEVRESNQIIPLQNQSVIHLDEMENENSKYQLGQDSTINSMKESIQIKSLVMPFKFNNYRNSQEFIPDSQLNIERTVSIQHNLTMNLKTNIQIEERDDILNKKIQKDEGIEESIKLKMNNYEIKKNQNNLQNIKIESKCRMSKEGLSPIHLIQEDEYPDYDNSEYNTESSNEAVKNNESPCTNPKKENSIGSLMWKQNPFKQSPKLSILTVQDRINQMFDSQKDKQKLPILDKEAIIRQEHNVQLNELGQARKHSDVYTQGINFYDEEKNRKINLKQTNIENRKEEQQFLESPYLESIKKSMSDLASEIDEVENQEIDEHTQDNKDEIQPIQIISQIKLQSGQSNYDGEQSPIPHSEVQQQEACKSQVKRSLAIQKLNMSLNMKPQSLLDIQKPESSNESFNGICLSKNNLSILQKPQCEGQQIRSSMSLMERRHQSLRQSINLDTSKNMIKPTQVSNDPKADYLHFLSARPFFWEYYCLQMYCQVFRNLILQLGRGLQGQISRSLTSSPTSNSQHLNQLYQQQILQSNEDDLNRDRKKSNDLPFNPALMNTSAWKEKMSTSEQKYEQNSSKIRNKKIGSFVFQNISNSLSVVRIFSMRKTFESFSDVYSEVSWPFLFFDSTQINAGDSRFKTEPAIQNFQNKQILQSCLFRSQFLIHMVGSYHFTVPPKYKFFSQNTTNVTVSQVVSQMNTQNDQFPGDFQRAINGLFSLGGQISALWTIAVAQTQPIKPICVRSQTNRSKSSTFSHSYANMIQRNSFMLPTLISTPSIFKTQKQEILQDQNNSDQQDENKKDEVDSQTESDSNTQNQSCNNLNQMQKSTFYDYQKDEDSAKLIPNNIILNFIEINQNNDLNNGNSQSPKSNTKRKNKTEDNKDEQNSLSPNSISTTPKANTFQQYYQRQLNEQEERYLIRICDVLSRNPAQICDLKNKGTLDEGKHADIIIFDPLDTYEFSAFIDEKQKFPAELHILNSQKVQGRVVTTYLRGQKIYDEEKFYTGDFLLIDKI